MVNPSSKLKQIFIKFFSNQNNFSTNIWSIIDKQISHEICKRSSQEIFTCDNNFPIPQKLSRPPAKHLPRHKIYHQKFDFIFFGHFSESVIEREPVRAISSINFSKFFSPFFFGAERTKNDRKKSKQFFIRRHERVQYSNGRRKENESIIRTKRLFAHTWLVGVTGSRSNRFGCFIRR